MNKGRRKIPWKNCRWEVETQLICREYISRSTIFSQKSHGQFVISLSYVLWNHRVFLWLLSAFFSRRGVERSERSWSASLEEGTLRGHGWRPRGGHLEVKRFQKWGETEKCPTSQRVWGFLDDYYWLFIFFHIICSTIHFKFRVEFASGSRRMLSFLYFSANYTVSWSKTTELPGYLGRGGGRGRVGGVYDSNGAHIFECLIFFGSISPLLIPKFQKKSMKEWNESQILVHTYMFFWITRIYIKQFFVGLSTPWLLWESPWQSSPGEASVSAVIKVRSETTEVTKAELSEATPAGEIGWRLAIVGAWWVRETFLLSLRNYYELWKLDVTEGTFGIVAKSELVPFGKEVLDSWFGDGVVFGGNFATAPFATRVFTGDSCRWRGHGYLVAVVSTFHLQQFCVSHQGHTKQSLRIAWVTWPVLFFSRKQPVKWSQLVSFPAMFGITKATSFAIFPALLLTGDEGHGISRGQKTSKICMYFAYIYIFLKYIYTHTSIT